MSARAAKVGLGLLLLWSLGLRVWMALPGLDSRRFWDERYPLENVEPILKQGSFRPANGLHPALTHLPHTALLKLSDVLYRVTDIETFAVFDDRGSFSPTTYFICRMLQVVLGVASLLFVYWIGCVLDGRQLGLLAAFLTAVVPWHLRQSATFKSDIVLVFSMVLTFVWTLRAVRRPTIGRYAAVGAGVGLALSSKFNGGPIAIPLIVGTLVSRDRSLRTFLYLVAAGVVSLAVFLAINPYVLLDFSIYQESFGRTLRVYERHGVMQGVDSNWEQLGGILISLMSGAFHGPLVATLGLVGGLWLLVVSVPRARESERALGWVMLLSFLISYPVLFVLTTNNPSPHNWLPLAPFLALIAAWTLIEIWALMDRQVAGTWWRKLAAAALVILVVGLSWRVTEYTYRSVVPSTGFVVLDRLSRELKRPPGRTVVAEHKFGLWRQSNYRKAALAIDEVDDLTLYSPSQLNRFDAEVFAASRLDDPENSDFYRRRMARNREGGVVRVRPRLFRSWGPELIVLLHPLKPMGAPLAGTWLRSETDPSLYHAIFAHGQTPQGIVSFEFGLPGREVGVSVSAGTEHLRSLTFRAPRHHRYQTTPRFRFSPEVTMRLQRPRGGRTIPFVVKRWRRPKNHNRLEIDAG